MMERTESRFFVKQSLPKGLMGAFLLFCVTFLMFLFVEGAFFYPRYGFLQQLRKENQEVLFFYRHYDEERENRLYGKLAALEKEVPPERSTSQILQALTQWGEASGCRLLFLRSGSVKEKNGVMAQTVELSLEGSYFEILIFSELFEQKGQGMHAEETLLKRSEKGNKLIFQTKIVYFATKIVTM